MRCARAPTDGLVNIRWNIVPTELLSKHQFSAIYTVTYLLKIKNCTSGQQSELAGCEVIFERQESFVSETPQVAPRRLDVDIQQTKILVLCDGGH